MQQAMTTAYNTWDEIVPPLREERKALEAESQIARKVIEELESRTAGYNPLRWLFNKVAQWQQVPELKAKVAGNDKRLEDIGWKIIRTADQCASMICVAYVRNHPEEAERRNELLRSIEQTQEECALFAEALERTVNVLEKIDWAWSKADSAQDMEHWDAFSNNRGIDLLSHLETSDAASALQEIRGTLETYKEYLELRFGRKHGSNVARSAISNVVSGNNFDLVADMFGGFLGSWASLENADRLGEAKGKLDKVRSQIEGIRVNFSVAHSTAAARQNVARAALSSFRKDILDKLIEKGGVQSRAFLGEIKTNMSPDQQQLREQNLAKLEARMG